MGYHLPIRERLLFVSAGMILVIILPRKTIFQHELNNTVMNSEEQKKKELEKRGEDNPGSGELPGSGQEQRKDAEPVKEGETGVQNKATEDLNATRTTGSTPGDQAGVSDIDSGLNRGKE
jgi:hypothetical protein